MATMNFRHRFIVSLIAACLVTCVLAHAQSPGEYQVPQSADSSKTAVDTATGDGNPQDRRVPATDMVIFPKVLRWRCGDVCRDGLINISDVCHLIYYVRGGGPKPIPPEAGDVDCNGFINEDDVWYLLYYVFADGTEPCADCPQQQHPSGDDSQGAIF